MFIGALAAAATLFVPAHIVRVTDGDTVQVSVPAWKETPFENIAVRVYGIDTPESVRGRAKCESERQLGLRAKTYAKGLAQPGDNVIIGFVRLDKYGGRIDGTITFVDGTGWAPAMIAAGYAKPYEGGTKLSWCPSRKRK